MDKINLVSSQAAPKLSCSMDTRSKFSSPLVNSLVKNRLFKTTLPFQFIHTMGLTLVDMTLRDSRDLVIHRIEIWLFRGHSFGEI